MFDTSIHIFPVYDGLEYKSSTMSKTNWPFSSALSHYSTMTISYHPGTGAKDFGKAKVTTEPRYLVDTPFLKIQNPLYPQKTTVDLQPKGAPLQMPDMTVSNVDVTVNGTPAAAVLKQAPSAPAGK